MRSSLNEEKVGGSTAVFIGAMTRPDGQLCPSTLQGTPKSRGKGPEAVCLFTAFTFLCFDHTGSLRFRDRVVVENSACSLLLGSSR